MSLPREARILWSEESCCGLATWSDVSCYHSGVSDGVVVFHWHEGAACSVTSCVKHEGESRMVAESGAETMVWSPGVEAETYPVELALGSALGVVTGHDRTALAFVISWWCGHNALEWTV